MKCIVCIPQSRKVSCKIGLAGRLSSTFKGLALGPGVLRRHCSSNGKYQSMLSQIWGWHHITSDDKLRTKQLMFHCPLFQNCDYMVLRCQGGPSTVACRLIPTTAQFVRFQARLKRIFGSKGPTINTSSIGDHVSRETQWRNRRA